MGEKRLARLGSYMHYIRMGYSNYVAYGLVALTFINTMFLTLIALNISINYILFVAVLVPLGVALLFAVGSIHYKRGLYEGQINVDIANNPWFAKIIPGKERVFAAAFLLVLKMLSSLEAKNIDENTRRSIDRTVKELNELLEGKNVA